LPPGCDAVVELLHGLARGTDVDVEVVDLRVGLLLDEVGQLQRVHAADAGAVAVGVLVAAPDAVDDADRFGLLAVAQDDLAGGGPRRVDQAFHLQPRVDVGIGAVAVVRDALGIEHLEPGRQDDRPDLDLLDRLLLLEVDRVAVAAGLDAGLGALSGLELDAGLRVDDDELRHRLREGHVDRLPVVHAQVELVRRLALLEDAGLDALLAADAQVFDDVAGLAPHLHREVAHVSVDLGDLGVRPDGDVGMRLHVRHLRGEDAGGAVERGEGLVELGHVAADRRLAFHEVDVLAAVGEGERSLDAGDPAAHDQHGGVDVDAPRLQRLVKLDAPHRPADERPALVGGRHPVLVDPGVVLPDIDHLEEVRVQAPFRRRVAEGLFVQAGRTGGDHDPREVVVADVLLDQLLPWVGANVLVLE
jgi:hypothetical protein